MNYPLERLFVVLASEERGGLGDAATAAAVQTEFGSEFGGFLTTVHPGEIPGELPGKGSNETWAARTAVRELIDARGIPHDTVLVSVFDMDTRVAPEYFGILTFRFLTAPHPLRSSYQPTPVFSNNFHAVPVFARLIGLSATFWQLMQQGRPEQLVTFSSHSMPLPALVAVGYWDTTIVSEDSRIFFQCLLRYRGDWRSVPLIYPVYMDAVAGHSFFGAMRNLYKQQRRWAWGVENFPYLIEAFHRTPGIPVRVRWFWLWRTFDGFYSWATSSFVIFLFGVLPNVLGGDLFLPTETEAAHGSGRHGRSCSGSSCPSLSSCSGVSPRLRRRPGSRSADDSGSGFGRRRRRLPTGQVGSRTALRRSNIEPCISVITHLDPFRSW